MTGWSLSAVVLLSALRIVNPGAPWPDGVWAPDGNDSGDALRADAAGRYLQLNSANAQ